MDPSRLLTVARKDIMTTTREGFFLFFLFMPILASLILNATLGTVGTATPDLAVYGTGELVTVLDDEQAIDLRVVSSAEDLRNGVLEGRYDAGLLISPSPTLLISGESLLSERITIGATLARAYQRVSGEEGGISFEERVIGTEEYSLKVRLIPFVLILTTIVGGLLISTSLIEEREKKTLNAILITPLTPGEAILAKSLFGLFIGLTLGVIILLLNGSLTGGLILILVFLILGTLFSVGLGLMAGVVMDSITDLIARMKIFNFFLVLPALVLLFPQIPQWIGKLFPTYYFVHPLLMITQKGAGWSDVWWEAGVLLACDLIVLALASKVLRKRMLGEEIRG